MRILNPTIGCDFELFLFDKKKQAVIDAKPYVKGSKKKPFNFDKSSPFWCTSLDNISFEGNIAPCTSAVDFDKSIEKVINYLNSTLPEDIIPIHECAVRVNEDQLVSKESRTFGCEPSYNAYTCDMNASPEAMITNLRTCCTHVHIRYDGMNIETSLDLIKAMDLFLGLPSVVIEPPNERRTMYGTLGEMRYDDNKTTEYRVLSSFFSETRDRRQWVFNNTMMAINWINSGKKVTARMGEEFQRAMNEFDVRFIEKLISKYNIPLTA